MPKSKNSELYLFITLTSLFIAALITCNLIANKFVEIDLGFKTFIVSAGILPYPLTFLITDILSEIYGRKMTNRVVMSGFFASMMVLFFLCCHEFCTQILRRDNIYDTSAALENQIRFLTYLFQEKFSEFAYGLLLIYMNMHIQYCTIINPEPRSLKVFSFAFNYTC